jgi:hypothetical protein
MSYTGWTNTDWLEGTYSTSSYDEPISLVMWTKLTAAQWADTSIYRYGFAFTAETATEENTFSLGTGINADTVFARQYGATSNAADVAFTDGRFDDIWVPIIGTFSNDNPGGPRRVYIENSQTTGVQGSTFNVALGSTPIVWVGRRVGSTLTYHGLIAEVAIFDKVLTTAEIDTLQTGIGQGIPPIMAAPQNCIGYWPLKNDQSSHADQAYRNTGAPTLTATGSPTYSSDHPIMSALPSVKCILTERNGTRQQSLTSLKWAWFDETDPQNFNAPVNVGTIETTDANGLIEVDIPGTTLTQGQEGCLAVMTSDNVDMGLYKLMIL